MRILNSSTLLKMIWRDREISRADISQRTGMSRSTVSTIVADLIRRGLVTETGTGHSNGGRRPVILSFNEDAYSILGIDLRVDSVRVAITNLRAGVRHWWQGDFHAADDIDVWIQKAKAQCVDDGKPLIGIGIGLPASLPGQETLISHLREKISLPLVTEKDANLGALSELWWRDPKGAGNIAYIHSHRQAGLIIDGRVYRGSHGMAGDLGVAEDGSEPDDEQLVDWIRNLITLLDLDAVVLNENLLQGSESRLEKIRLAVRRTARIDFVHRREHQVALGASTQILNQALDDFSIFPAVPAGHYPWTWNRESTFSP